MTKWKRDNYKFWHSPIALIVIFCLLALFGYKIIDLIQKNIETVHKKELILEQIDLLKKRESILSQDISKLETTEGKEEIIREKYQVAKQGEKMVTIVNNTDKDTKADDEKVSHGLLSWLKGIFSK